MKFFQPICLALVGYAALTSARPQAEIPADVQLPAGFVPVNAITHCQTGEVIHVDAASIDKEGCLVGPCGEKNCPTGAYGVGNDKVTHRGNAGPRNTGSNGNAGPIDAQGRPINPAEIAYLKQIENYKKWELQQQENNKKIIG